MKLEKYIQMLTEVGLFKGFEITALSELFKTLDYKLQSYGREDIIFIEDDHCKNLSVILEGMVEIQKIDPNGKVLTVAVFEPGDVFGESLIFSDRNRFPMTVVSKSDSVIMHIDRASVVKLCQTQTSFLYEYLRILSNKALVLSRKLKEVTLKTIRQKICEFIVEQSRIQGSEEIKINMTKKEWADKIGVQRPSLSRELIKMKEEGILDYYRDVVIISDMDVLEEYL